MPIYEFYCSDCNTIFSFFSRSADTEARPGCPRCGRMGLDRRPSRFAIGRASGESEPEMEGDDPFAGMDEERLEQVMGSMAGELDSMGDGDEDPRAMARMLRKFGEAAGMEAGPRMEEMLSRLESGEDPESLEQEMVGDDDEGDLSEWFQLKSKAEALRDRLKRPQVDDTLYFL